LQCLKSIFYCVEPFRKGLQSWWNIGISSRRQPPTEQNIGNALESAQYRCNRNIVVIEKKKEESTVVNVGLDDKSVDGIPIPQRRIVMASTSSRAAGIPQESSSLSRAALPSETAIFSHALKAKL
jgi:hypothetical protein